MRYNLRLSKSTGQVIGYQNSIFSTTPGMKFLMQSIRANLDGDVLKVHQSVPLYSDCFAAGGKYYACAYESNIEYSAKDALLTRKERNTLYKVDPATLTRTQNDEPVEEIEETEVKK